MKKFILSTMIAGASLMAADAASVYKSGVLLPPMPEKIYQKECVSCHGADGKQTTFSGTKVTYSPITGLDSAALAQELKTYRFGRVNKYGYGALMKSSLADLSYEEIDSLAEYISKTFK